MDAIDIIVSGHLCIDLIPGMTHVTPDALTKSGRLIEVDPVGISTGGAVSNTGLALHRLGVNVRLMATVGDDLLGQLIIAFLKARGDHLTELINVQSGQPSSYTVVLSPSGADRTFLHCTGTNSAFGVENVDFALVAHSKIFHLGYPPILPRLIMNDGEELCAIYRQAKETGVVASMDMTLPDPHGVSGRVNWPTILKNTLPYVDIFVPSIEEIVFMCRRADYDNWHGDVLPHLNRQYLAELAAELIDMGAVIVGFKLGAMGLYLRTADAHFERLSKLSIHAASWKSFEHWQPAFQVKVAGTTGAGDSAYAGFLGAVLRGMSPVDCMRWACAVSACNVEAADSTSGIRTWDETGARLAADWPTRPEHLPGF